MSESRSALGRVLRSPGFRLFVIGALVLLLMIPLLMARALVTEREMRARDVQLEVARGWGGQQSIRGPYLVVPFVQRVAATRDGKREEQLVERLAVFLPEKLEISGKVGTRQLKRSIYAATVYDAQLRISGEFGRPDVNALAADVAQVRWERAVLVLALSDVAGLKEVAALKPGDGAGVPFEPSLGLPGLDGSGMHARIGARAREGFGYTLSLRLSGSGRMDFAPAARDTRVKLRSDWPHPSFDGAFLPVERQVGAEGFSASWRVPHLARSVPQAWVLDAGGAAREAAFIPPDMPPQARMKLAAAMAQAAVSRAAAAGLERFGAYMFGVRFFVPVDHYDLVSRAMKYGLMFLATVFGALFLMELLSGARVHAVQYLLVGLMLVLFFVLLLSLAEHVGFTPAYVIASVATGGVLSLYAARVLRSARKGLAMLALFAALFALLYMILRMEDHALLAGAIVAFIGLTAAMFLTLKVDWSGKDERDLPPAGSKG